MNSTNRGIMHLTHIESYSRSLTCRGVEFKLNQFADLSEDEFRRNVLMRPKAAPQHVKNVVK